MPAPSAASASHRRALLRALIPLVLDVALPIGLYYLLSDEGVADAPALILSGLIPGVRALVSLITTGNADYVAVMMVAQFALALILLAFTGSPRFLLLKESFGTALLGLWCLGGAWSARPMTFYTARPMVTKGRPDALRSWERLANTSTTFRSIQRRLALVWGVGLLVEAAIHVLIVAHYPVHTAAGLVNIPGIVMLVGLSILSGPAGGSTLQRLVSADIRASSEPRPDGRPESGGTNPIDAPLDSAQYPASVEAGLGV